MSSEEEPPKYSHLWMSFVENTTFHGLYHITMTTGWTRIYYCVVLGINLTLFLAHASLLGWHFTQRYIVTDLKPQVRQFVHPDVTLCPMSPFTADDEAKLPPTVANDIYSVYSFWNQFQSQRNISGTSLYAKHSLVRTYFREFPVELKKSHFRSILMCRVGGLNCHRDFILSEHPQFYRCFTLQIRRTNFVTEQGPTNGIQVVLHRGNSSSPPSLLVDPTWNPRLKAGRSTTKQALSYDGYYVILHEKGTFPTGDIAAFPTAFSVRFGHQVRVTVRSTHYQASPQSQRPCFPLVMVQEFQSLDTESRNLLRPQRRWLPSQTVRFTHAGCLAALRQELVLKNCGCYTANAYIPLELFRPKLAFCHELLWRRHANASVVLNMLACVQRVEQMRLKELLKHNKEWKEKCRHACNRNVYSLDDVNIRPLLVNISSQQLKGYFELLQEYNESNPYIQPQSTVLAKDLLLLDINTDNRNIDVLEEKLQYTVISFLSELGGTCGLYLGFTVYTLFEFADLYLRWWRQIYRWLAHSLGKRLDKYQLPFLPARPLPISLYACNSTDS